MRLTLCCVGTLMLIVCCWQSMAMTTNAKKRPPADDSHSKKHNHSGSKEHDHSSSKEHDHSHSKEHDHSGSKEHDHSHSKEHDHSSSKEHDHSHSKEHDHSGSKEHDHSHSKEHDHSSSKEHDHSHSKEHDHSKERDPSKPESKSCNNGKINKRETDIDCGGKKCSPCANNKKCLINQDCISKSCKNGRCAQRSTGKPSLTTPMQATTTTATEESISTTSEEPFSTTPEEPFSTTSEEPFSIASEEPFSTTSEEPFSTTSEEPLSTTSEEPLSTTPDEPLSTTPEEVMTTGEEELDATEEAPIQSQIICNPECKNDGKCIANNICVCPADFSGPTCEVQSTGLCLDEDTFDVEPILKVTFGNGSRQFSYASPAELNFTTTYQQKREPNIDDGYFAFVNSIYNHFDAWHTGEKDHTGDEGGYMYLVNANFEPGQFYNGRVDNLCVGLRYEFSVYLANLCKKAGRIEPNVLFEVRSTNGNELLAQLNSGNIPETDTLTWKKYGFSFVATSNSVNLLMISNARGGSGNDIVIDDIALRVCAHKGFGLCPSK